MPNGIIDFTIDQGRSGEPGAPLVRPTTVETLRYTENLTEETLKVIEKVLQEHDLSVSNGEFVVSLAQALGIDVSRLKNDLLLYGEVMFTKRGGQIMYLPPDQVEFDMGNGHDMFGVQYLCSERVPENPLFTGEIGRVTPGPVVVNMDSIREALQTIWNRPPVDLPNFIVREEIGITVYNPAGARALDIAGVDPELVDMMHENGWTHASEPSKKTREWEERWRK